MLLLICNNQLLEWKDRKITRYQSPRRLRAKYTPRTNLRFMLSVFRPCREQSHAGVTYTNAVAFGYAGYGNKPTTIPLILSVRTPFPLAEEGEESTLTTRHSFIQMTKLSNVRGRITYISSPGSTCLTELVNPLICLILSTIVFFSSTKIILLCFPIISTISDF